jgi:hypothetical protein
MKDHADRQGRLNRDVRVDTLRIQANCESGMEISRTKTGYAWDISWVATPDQGINAMMR